MTNAISLKPYYVACVSGGKDSLYMLNVILNNLDKYPLNAVVHFKLEIDYPFIDDVCNLYKKMCSSLGIKYMEFKPRHTWIEQYNKWGFPQRLGRWCNSSYKMEANQELSKYLKQFGFYSVCYIGLCADEKKRFKYDIGNWDKLSSSICYPLAEENINEDYILKWSRNIDVFNDYYKFNKRCGCMLCPMLSNSEFVYLYKKYPQHFEKYFDLVSKSPNPNIFNGYTWQEKKQHIIDIAYKYDKYHYTIFDFIDDIHE